MPIRPHRESMPRILDESCRNVELPPDRTWRQEEDFEKEVIILSDLV